MARSLQSDIVEDTMMDAHTDRTIDWQIADLEGGLSSTLSSLALAHAPLIQVEQDVSSFEITLVSAPRVAVLPEDLSPPRPAERQPEPPILDSLAPMALGAAEPIGGQVDVNPASARPSAATRKRPTRAEKAFWGATAGLMSILALGLVTEVGLDSVAPSMRATRAAAAEGEGGPRASRPALTTALSRAADADRALAPGGVTEPMKLPETASLMTPAIAETALPPQVCEGDHASSAVCSLNSP